MLVWHRAPFLTLDAEGGWGENDRRCRHGTVRPSRGGALIGLSPQTQRAAGVRVDSSHSVTLTRD